MTPKLLVLPATVYACGNLAGKVPVDHQELQEVWECNIEISSAGSSGHIPSVDEFPDRTLLARRSRPTMMANRPIVISSFAVRTRCLGDHHFQTWSWMRTRKAFGILLNLAPGPLVARFFPNPHVDPPLPVTSAFKLDPCTTCPQLLLTCVTAWL